MKLIFLVFCVLLGSSASGQLLRPDPERATLVFFREYPSRFGGECWACNYHIRVNDRRICNLSENRFVVYTTAPGSTLVESQPARSFLGVRRRRHRLMMQLQANQVYYIRCDQETNRLSERGSLQMSIDDVAKAIPVLAGMKPDACTDNLLVVD